MQGLTRETTIVRDAQGRWFQEGIQLTHPQLTRAFDSWIDIADDGRYCLKNAINWAYVTIKGAPIFVRSAHITDGGLELALSDGRTEHADLSTLRYDEQQQLYCTVRDGRLPAMFDSHAMTALVPYLDSDAQGFYITVGSQRYPIPKVMTPLKIQSHA